MDAEVSNTFIRVTLSRRNLLALLHKLEMAGSHRMIGKELANGLTLTIKAEEDEESYQEREPGRMHPETEKFILKNGMEAFKVLAFPKRRAS